MRKKHAAALLLAAALLTGAVAVAADPGSAGDPLISLDWLRNTFIPQTVTKAEERIDARYEGLSQEGGAVQSVEYRLKRGDVLRLESGSQITLLAGEAAGTSNGAIVDVTDGKELASGKLLSVGHRCIVAEKSTGTFSVSSDTAVVQLAGKHTISPSSETDYNALADALKAMGLFKGTDTPYGSGYDLEQMPTRIQGLILFLRLLGEEQAALNYNGSVELLDVPQWAQAYVAYAYDRGYTKGVGVDDQGRVAFAPNSPLAADNYVTFLLRDLGYQEGKDFHWDSASTDAVTLGLLTRGERTLLTGSPFLRAQTVYLSYFALSAKVKGSSETVLQRLTASGTVDGKTASTAMNAVKVKRL